MPGLDFELTSEHAMAVEGLEVSRKSDEHGVVRGHATHAASGETAQLTACRKLFCLSNVPVKAAHFESRVMDETTLAAKATKATIDLRQLETKMGFLSPNVSQQVCEQSGATSSRKGHVPAAIDHIAKGTKVPVKKILRSDRDAQIGEHIVCDPMGDSFEQSKAGNRAHRPLPYDLPYHHTDYITNGCDYPLDASAASHPSLTSTMYHTTTSGLHLAWLTPHTL